MRSSRGSSFLGAILSSFLVPLSPFLTPLSSFLVCLSSFLVSLSSFLVCLSSLVSFLSWVSFLVSFLSCAAPGTASANRVNASRHARPAKERRGRRRVVGGEPVI